MTRALDLHLPVGSHARRLNRLIDHIETHLADDLCLDKLAELAAFSPFHLHRLFRAWTGETLRDFVRRRRLETAGNRLRYDRELSIGELAHSCGFASAETFARACCQQAWPWRRARSRCAACLHATYSIGASRAVMRR